MAKTRFSLGYEYKNSLTSLSVFVSGDTSGDELVGSDLTDVIKFTTSFNNEKQLRDYLKRSKGNTNIPDDANLVYLKETPYGYYKVLDLDHICYADSTSLLEPDAQVSFFIDNKYDVNLIEELYIMLIKTYSNPKQVRDLYTEDDKLQDTNSKFISVFQNNKSKIDHANSFIFLFMDEVYSESCEANRRGIDNYEYDLDRKNLDYLIKRLYDSITIIKDKKGNFKYNQNNGKIERYSRLLGYFAIFISKYMKDIYNEYSEAFEREYQEEAYREYMKELEDNEKDNPNNTDVYNFRDITSEDEHDEEYLTVEDFEAKGLDPESNGYKKR